MKRKIEKKKRRERARERERERERERARGEKTIKQMRNIKREKTYAYARTGAGRKNRDMNAKSTS